MKLRVLITSMLTMAVACSANSAQQPSAGSEKTPKRPNVLVLIADDMGYGDIGAFGSEILTPSAARRSILGV